MKDWLWVGPLTAFVAVGTFFSGGGHDGLTAWQWVSVLVASLAASSLALVRHAPAAAVLTVGGLAATYFSLGFHDGPVYLPLLLASYAAAARLSLRRWVPLVAGAVGLVLLGMVIRAATTDIGWWQPFWQGIGVTGLAAAAGAIGSLVSSRQQTAAERARRAATEEQLRMAQDLHDGVGHGLAVIAMQAGVALHVLDKDPAGVRGALEAIRDTSREALESLRVELSHLAGEPAPRTPLRGLDDLDPLVTRVAAAGLSVVREVERPIGLAADVDAAAYAILQEALTNVLRHADAHSVVLRLARVGDTLELSVTDDGRGGPVHDEGMGLKGMRERTAALGGSLVTVPSADGFEVRAVFPEAFR